MIHPSAPGRIRSDFYCLGPPGVPVFLLKSEIPVLFEAGVSLLSSYYIEQTAKILNEDNPRLLFLSHAHFDHCGAAGYFKKHYAGLEIAASQAASDILARSSAIALIEKLNNPSGDPKGAFIPFRIDRILNDGDTIDVSHDLHVDIIATPGHTRDMMSFYIRELRILIPSEAAGVVTEKGYIFSEFLINYELYINSLLKLKTYDADILMLAHGFHVTGHACKEYLNNALIHAERFYHTIETLIMKYGDDLESIAAVIKSSEYDVIKGDKQPLDAYMLNLRAKINAVKKSGRLSN